jgi:cytochrome c biogenesis protein CcmG/thiol:disulfide interchange protein DsbE
VNRVSRYVPLLVLAAIVGFGYAGFRFNDPHKLPSAMLDKPFPQFAVPLLGEAERLVDREALLGWPVLVNVWATWCPTCKAEHDELMRIRSTTGLRLVGINYKDDPIAALQWLADYGDPYEFVMQDGDGSLAIELGVYGAPESFLLDAMGTILYKRVGDINRGVWTGEIVPILARLGVDVDE